MNKKLFTQIRNEWRSNLWLVMELLVVSVVMWYIIDLLYCRLATYMEPRGFDTEHCYLIDMGVHLYGTARLRHGALLSDRHGRTHRQESRLYTL